MLVKLFVELKVGWKVNSLLLNTFREVHKGRAGSRSVICQQAYYMAGSCSKLTVAMT